MHLDPTSKISRSCKAGAPPGESTDSAIGGARLGRPAARRLGSATAALAAAVLMFMNLGAGEARANDLSTWPCTAGDVEIVGSGIVLNEPCSCPPGSTFNAVVQFTVRNNTSSGRYCIALHLVPDGAIVTTTLDVILKDAGGNSTAPGKSGSERFHDTVMYGTIANFPCSTGMVCFGQAAVVKGKCVPGACTTISWNTSNGAANCTTADQNPPGGQCRHQQVCVVGYGASLSCAPNCNVTCGSNGTLQGCAIGPTNRGPFTLTLAGSDGSSQTQSVFGDPSGVTCLNFTVTPAQFPSTSYTLTVMDKNGCTRTATASLSVSGSPSAGAGTDQTKCAPGGTTPFTLAGTASNGTATWSVVNGPVTIANPSNLNSGATFNGTGTATLRLTVSNSPCPAATDDVVLAVNGNPTAGAGTHQTKCAAGETTPFTLAGSASYGTATWSVLNGPATLADPSNLSSGVTFTGTGTATLRLTVTSTANPPCPTATGDVVLAVNGNPTAGAGPDQSKCVAGGTTPFTLAGSASYGTATWSVLNGPVTIADPSNLGSGATFTGTGTATLRLTVTSTANPPCPTATEDVVLTVRPTTVTITPASDPVCNGMLVYTASVDNHTGCSFAWTIDGLSPAAFASDGSADDARLARLSGDGNGKLEFRALDNLCHTIQATATCTDGNETCTGIASTTAKQCVSSTPGCK